MPVTRLRAATVMDRGSILGLAKSNSHLYVVMATNLYLPRYDAEPTGDKRIQLELVRLLCEIGRAHV